MEILSIDCGFSKCIRKNSCKVQVTQLTLYKLWSNKLGSSQRNYSNVMQSSDLSLIQQFAWKLELGEQVSLKPELLQN